MKRPSEYAVIPTATVLVSTTSENWYHVRALLDSGSEVSLISLDCANRIGAHIHNAQGSVTGIGGLLSRYLGTTSLHLFQGNTLLPDVLVKFFIIDHIMTLPSQVLPYTEWPEFSDLQLADSQFFTPHPVDVILSAEIVAQLMESIAIPRVHGHPQAQKTKVGWVIYGSFNHRSSRRVRFHSSVRSNNGKTNYLLPIRDSNKTQPTALIADKPTSCVETPSVLQQATPPTSIEVEQGTYAGHSEPSMFQLNMTRLQLNWDTSHLTMNPLVYHVVESGFNKTSPITAISALQPTPSSMTPTEVQSLIEALFRGDSIPEAPSRSPDQLLAEELFLKTCSRTSDGRFTVGLLLKQDPITLGASRNIALRRFYQLEHRLRKDSHKYEAYRTFMEDYLKSGHMELAPPAAYDHPTYYLPHHAVHRTGDPPTKIRVVFNASQKTANGVSLNDILLPGPRLQQDITTVITGFRQDAFVFMADIRQMFRQIQHPPDDRDLLRIFWRNSAEVPVTEYRLTTVTYGTACAPFTACRVLRELSSEHASTHPAAVKILENRCYVDDINGGADSLELAIQTRLELQSLLAKGRLELRKWASNCPELLEGIPHDHLLPRCNSVSFDETAETELKMLGLCWDPTDDCFRYKLQPASRVETKRELASQIARIFDPLGWLAPVITYARGLFRQVCQNEVDWDSKLPSSIALQWNRFSQELPSLSNLTIPRHIPKGQRQILVGFADASEVAYAAVIYIVTVDAAATTVVLVASRMRLAPVKPVTIPRLELCAAVLLAELASFVAKQFPNISSEDRFFFSDSTVTLSWITSPSPVWQTYVRNRVAVVCTHTQESRWFHVRSEDNPADHASRGLLPHQFLAKASWLEGPEWLKTSGEWPIMRVRPLMEHPEVQKEIRKAKICTVASGLGKFDPHIANLLEQKASTFLKLQSTTAWLFRFKYNCLNSQNRRNGPLLASEREQATHALIWRAQQEAFPQEIHDAHTGMNKTHMAKQLSLFVSPDGILRVGGRLSQAPLQYSSRHPALLPSHCALTRLIIDHSHIMNLHVGPAATLAHVRQKYWIVNGREVVRRRLMTCNRCFSLKPKPFQPPMGQLPVERTQLISPFHTTGVDYAGPFDASVAGLRGGRILKVYLCLFICFATKAVHIEVATDLSTQAFLAAYRRFVARRGLPKTVWSDHGSNFEGAATEIKKIQALFLDNAHRDALETEASKAGTEWKFIPPRAPHFGGLWEAGVKIAKRLLRSTLQNFVPTLEQMITLSAQVESVLNSRPLTAFSSSPDDFAVLTPGHFLVHRPLNAAPTDLTITDRSSLRSKWDATQNAFNQLWRRWQHEYLLDQQRATKWTSPESKPNIGEIVIIMEDNLPPLQWKMGIITATYPGPDEVVRAVDVKTTSGVFRRPLRKLCPLPTQ